MTSRPKGKGSLCTLPGPREWGGPPGIPWESRLQADPQTGGGGRAAGGLGSWPPLPPPGRSPLGQGSAGNRPRSVPSGWAPSDQGLLRTGGLQEVQDPQPGLGGPPGRAAVPAPLPEAIGGLRSPCLHPSGPSAFCSGCQSATFSSPFGNTPLLMLSGKVWVQSAARCDSQARSFGYKHRQ